MFGLVAPGWRSGPALSVYAGGVSERLMETVLKTVGAQALVGSNPTPSADSR